MEDEVAVVWRKMRWRDRGRGDGSESRGGAIMEEEEAGVPAVVNAKRRGRCYGGETGVGAVARRAGAEEEEAVAEWMRADAEGQIG
jgi:hypothetical protein